MAKPIVSLARATATTASPSENSSPFLQKIKPRRAGAQANKAVLKLNCLSVLYCVCHADHRAFLEMFCENLQPDRQACFGVSTRHRNARNAHQVGRYRIDVCQVHSQWIVSLFSELESRSRRGRRNDRVNLREGFVEILSQQGPDLLCLQIVGIVITCAQRVGPENDAPLYFGAEAFVATFAVHFRKSLRFWRTMRIAYTVIARQV